MRRSLVRVRHVAPQKEDDQSHPFFVLVHGMGLGGCTKHGTGEHGVPAGGLGRHAPVAVVGHGARRRRAQTDSRQTVHVVVCEGLLHVVRNVLSGG